MAERNLEFDNLKPNSDASRNTNYANPIEKKQEEKKPTEEPKLEKVVEGKVTQKKSSKFFGKDFKEFGKGLLDEVVKPRLKDFAYDFVDSAIRGILWHDTPGGSRGHRSGVGRGYTSYSRFSNGSNAPVNRNNGPIEISRSERETFKFGSYEFEKRSDAERVMDAIQGQVDQDGTVSVADYYACIGIDTQYQDHKWGWTDQGELRDMRIRMSRDGGFIIMMPDPIPLGRANR